MMLLMGWMLAQNGTFGAVSLHLSDKEFHGSTAGCLFESPGEILRGRESAGKAHFLYGVFAGGEHGYGLLNADAGNVVGGGNLQMDGK